MMYKKLIEENYPRHIDTMTSFPSPLLTLISHSSILLNFFSIPISFSKLSTSSHSSSLGKRIIPHWGSIYFHETLLVLIHRLRTRTGIQQTSYSMVNIPEVQSISNKRKQRLLTLFLISPLNSEIFNLLNLERCLNV